MLLGRASEREALGQLWGEARGGQCRVLVLCGEPGVGKTALLEDAVQTASGFLVARASGVEAEMELPFAALQMLCAPMLDRLDHLPEPQRGAIGNAFGLSSGTAPEQLLVGLAVLSLLADAARERPLLCVIDDAQWLDCASAQALAFVARRLLADPIAVLFATRERTRTELTGLPEMSLQGLADDAARALLSSVIAGPLDDRTRDRIVTETHGNPLALLELPRGRTPAEVALGFGVSDATLLPGRIEDRYRQRIDGLPAETQRLLLIAALEPLGEPARVRQAGRLLGIGTDAAQPAVVAGLLETNLRFHHPLVRSAVYRAATPEQRRRVHLALAEVTDPDADPEYRAWHRAQGATGPDEDLAEELERSAGRARHRGRLSRGCGPARAFRGADAGATAQGGTVAARCARPANRGCHQPGAGAARREPA
ncbi:MAG: AAA family ATPase [Solirubrobacterales bacterium]|nr:AAA family ATPase [Solirubrobacterales bacterium]